MININKNRVLLMVDGADGDGVDPFATAAANLEAPKFPLLAPDRICRFKIAKCTKDQVKDKPGREVLTVKLQTTKDYTDTDGKPLREGFTGYTRIGLTPSDESEGKRPRTNKNIAEDLGMLLKAVGMGEKTPRDLLNTPSMLEGQIVDMKVTVLPEKGGFPASNGFRVVLPG